MKSLDGKSMPSNLEGRVRNTSLPASSAMLPVFEAVVNSIHAVEEAGIDSNEGEISVEIIRSQKDFDFEKSNSSKTGPSATEQITGFRISDNGVGFNQDNMESFYTLDSEHKRRLGCKGVGRLVWLKAFDSVKVESWYLEKSEKLSRQFVFSPSGITGEDPQRDESRGYGSVINLNSIHKKYENRLPKTLEKIASSILEHCLWYFVREGGSPDITIIDDGESISLNELFDQVVGDRVKSEDIEIKDNEFNLLHVKLLTTLGGDHAISYCANDRLVSTEKIKGKVEGLYGRITEGDLDFVYCCYVSSDVLDENTRSERTGFDFDDLFSYAEQNESITEDEIRRGVLEASAGYLKPFLEENIKRTKKAVQAFVNNKAPRYRHVLKRLNGKGLNLSPTASDKEIDTALHKEYFKFESALIKEGHEIMKHLPEDDANYNERLQKYLSKAEELKQSDLASYVSHRRVIIDLLEKAIQIDEGKYSREDMIHNLIMPMTCDSDDVHGDAANLWLVDERLAFHDYLASDKTLKSMPITGAEQTKEPDVASLNLYDNPLLVSEGTSPQLASIVVVEIKRPMRNNMKDGEKDDPIQQALGYVKRIRDGGVKTSQGRPIPNSNEIPAYCYVLADLTPSMKDRCENASLTITSDGMGYFGYNPARKAYIEVISFDRLLQMAKERNRAFFDKLGLSAN